MTENGGEIQKLGNSDLAAQLMRSISDKIKNTHIKKSNCKLCMSKFRDEAENQFAQKGNLVAVTKYLKEQNEDITYKAVRNHMQSHYLREEKHQQILEYASDLDQWIVPKIDRRQNILLRIALLTKCMHEVAALGEGSSLEDLRRNSDIVKKLSDGITSLEDKIDEMDKDIEPVEIVISHLKNVIGIQMQNVRSDETKRVLKNVLEQVAVSLSDFDVEKKD